MASVGPWRRISDLGVGHLPPEEARKTRALNQFTVIAILSVTSYGLILVGLGPEYRYGVVVDFVAAALHLGTLWLTSRGKADWAVPWFLLLTNGQLYLVTTWAGPTVGYHYYFIAFATVPFLIVPRRSRWLLGSSLVSIGLFLYFAFGMDAQAAQVEFLNFHAGLFRIVSALATCLTLALIAFIFDRDATSAEAELAKAHERSEKLLLNILPGSISERLKRGEQSIADGLAEVTVLFADIVGFTQLSQRMPPEELVAALNEVFSAFDDLALKHGLEKIKTIGDCYMAASGLPEPRDDHAQAAVRMALEMVATLRAIDERRGHGLEVRIGLHSGPVVAGVIGKQKFIYDLWGDTVNTASRMESHGEKGRVQVSAATWALVKDAFVTEERPPMQIKGKGEMQPHLVLGPRVA